MCRMVDTGARWKREIELPPFGSSYRFLVVRYQAVGGDEQRYVRSPESWCDETVRDWMKPLYAIRVKAKNI